MLVLDVNPLLVLITASPDEGATVLRPRAETELCVRPWLTRRSRASCTVLFDEDATLALDPVPVPDWPRDVGLESGRATSACARSALPFGAESASSRDANVFIVVLRVRPADRLLLAPYTLREAEDAGRPDVSAP